ncbi:MAG: valyl-tRNA synthetase, partial [Cyclobacteriaceae bacterium]
QVEAPSGVNKEEEIQSISKELGYTRGFLKAVDQKLSNERFINNAPEAVVKTEQTKRADAEAKIKSLEESLKKLQG